MLCSEQDTLFQRKSKKKKEVVGHRLLGFSLKKICFNGPSIFILLNALFNIKIRGNSLYIFLDICNGNKTA